MSDDDKKVIDFMKSKGQDMVKHFQDMHQQLEKKEMTGVGGVEDADEIFVKVVLNGLQECKREKCVIGKGAYEEGPEVIVDLMAAAFNNAMEKLKAVMQTEVMDVYKKSNLPLTGDEGKGGEE